MTLEERANANAELKEKVIQAFADYLAHNQAGKGIALEMERRTLTPIHWAKEWALVRQAARLHGYPTVEETVEHLKRILQ